MKISLEKVSLIMLFLMPVGFSSLGFRLSLNISLADLLLPVYLVLILFHSNKENLFFRNNVYKGPAKIIFFFIFFLALSYLNLIRINGDLTKAIIDTMKIIICIFYAYVYYCLVINSKNYMNSFLRIASLSGVFFSLTCIIGAVLFYIGIANPFIDDYGQIFRAHGLLEDSNNAAIFQMLSLVYLMLYINLYSPGRIWYLGGGCIFLGILLTSSKSAMLTLFFSTFVSVVVIYFTRKSNIAHVNLIVVMAALGILLIGIFTPLLDTLVIRVSELFSGDSTTLMTGRNIIWGNVFDILTSDPLNFIFGIGIGQFVDALSFYNILGTVHTYTHNTYLTFLLEEGVIGFLFVLAFVLYLILYCVKTIIEKPGLMQIIIFWGYLSFFVVINSVSYQNNRMAYVFIAISYLLLKSKLKEVIK